MIFTNYSLDSFNESVWLLISKVFSMQIVGINTRMTLGILQHVLTVITGEKNVYLCLKIYMYKKCEKKSVFHLLSAHIKSEYTS